jgi:signal recognition particle subunit SRP54
MLVVDSMTGQEAVNVAQKFDEDLGIDGVILTKLDGDERGGAAISVKKVTGKPIKFIGTGEKLNEFEEFHPDRMASRILGMGDVLSIIEQAEATISQEEAEKLEKKLMKNKEMDLNDYLAQLRQIKKMGPLSSIMKLIPGMGQYADKVDDKELVRVESIISSMTNEERENPRILNGQRRIRIANGSGTRVQDINKFMQAFEATRDMMKKMSKGKIDPRMKKMMKEMNMDNFSEEDLEDLEKKLGKK